MKHLLIFLIALSAASCLQIYTEGRTLSGRRHKKVVVHKKKAFFPRRKVVVHKKKVVVHKKPVHKRGPSTSTWGSKTADTFNTQAATQGVAYGKGQTASFAGPAGVQTQAQGTRGTKNASSFNTKAASAHDNWGQTTGRFGKSNWASKGVSNVDLKSAANGITKGFGASGSQISQKGANANAKGSKGASSAASYDGKGNNAQNSNAATYAK